MPKDIFVDENDNVIGAGSREEAAEKGIIVRLIRIFVFNSKGELLIQKRSRSVNAPGLWDQSVGGHVDEGEDYLTAAMREMKEEIGIETAPPTEVVKYLFKADTNMKMRRRFETLYMTTYDGVIRFDPHDVAEVRWIEPDALRAWMKEKPEEFTRGFIHAFACLMLR